MFAATLPVFAQRIKMLAVSGLLALSLLGGAAATHVGAESVGSGGDSFTVACRALQDSVGPLVAEYGQRETTIARAYAILAELRNIGMTWDQIGCKDVFGSITRTKLPDPGTAPVRVVVGGQSQAFPDPTSPVKVAPGHIGGTALTLASE